MEKQEIQNTTTFVTQKRMKQKKKNVIRIEGI
jgi:hypothetical protein